MEYTFHSDAGHGWLEVHKDELELFGIADKVSSYSYVSGDKVYLEEAFTPYLKEKFSAKLAEMEAEDMDEAKEKIEGKS